MEVVRKRGFFQVLWIKEVLVLEERRVFSFYCIVFVRLLECDFFCFLKIIVIGIRKVEIYCQWFEEKLGGEEVEIMIIVCFYKKIMKEDIFGIIIIKRRVIKRRIFFNEKIF